MNQTRLHGPFSSRLRAEEFVRLQDVGWVGEAIAEVARTCVLVLRPGQGTVYDNCAWELRKDVLQTSGPHSILPNNSELGVKPYGR